jgi:hypothetical protein
MGIGAWQRKRIPNSREKVAIGFLKTRGPRPLSSLGRKKKGLDRQTDTILEAARSGTLLTQEGKTWAAFDEGYSEGRSLGGS